MSNNDDGNCILINILTYILVIIIDPDTMTTIKNQRIIDASIKSNVLLKL